MSARWVTALQLLLWAFKASVFYHSPRFFFFFLFFSLIPRHWPAVGGAPVSSLLRPLSHASPSTWPAFPPLKPAQVFCQSPGPSHSRCFIKLCCYTKKQALHPVDLASQCCGLALAEPSFYFGFSFSG